MTTILSILIILIATAASFAALLQDRDEKKTLLLLKVSIVLTAVVIILAASTANATEDHSVYLDIHGISKHFNTDRNYNEKNFGLGVTLLTESVGYSFGAYRNSLEKTSMYGSIRMSTQRVMNLQLAIEVGVVSGYVWGRLSPLVVPLLQGHLSDVVTVNMRYMPAIGDITPAVASLSLAVRLN